MGRHIFTHKIEIDFYFLCGVLTTFAVAFMDNDFLHKFIEHGGGQRIEVFILVDQSNKPFCGLLLVFVTGNNLLQFFNLAGTLPPACVQKRGLAAKNTS